MKTKNGFPRTHRHTALALAVIAALLAVTAALAATAGSLDPTFDGDGIVITDIGGTDKANAMVIQPDGRIIAAGYSDNLEYDYALARYNSDGSLDTTFDYDGKVVTDIRDMDVVEAIALQTDGKIVVAGYSITGGNYDFSLARYNSDGSLDATFDGDGKVVTDIGGNDIAYAMVIQPNGKIIVAGTSNNLGEFNYALARYNSDGSLDTAFDYDGIVVTNIRDTDIVKAIALQTDGKIVVAGHSITGSNHDFSLARYNSDGSLDTTFDYDGKVVTDFGGNDEAYAMLIQPDGRIVAAGYSDNLGEYNYALARYNSDGSLDTTFDYDGKVVTDIRDEDDGYAIALQTDGKIVVAGKSVTGGHADFSLARYNSDGSLDATFDGDGKVVTDIGGNDEAYAMRIQSDGRIVTAGLSDYLLSYHFALARYLANNAPTDITLSNNSVTENNPGSTFIGMLTTTDPDAGDTHTYSFCGGADDSSFGIAGNSLMAAAVFDYETKNTYNICIRTNDGHGGTFDKAFTITVTNVNEMPTNITLSNSTVAENQAVGTLVGNLSTADPDAGDTFTYSFCGGADDGSFQISGSQLQTNAVFDYETKNNYSICIRSTDAGGLHFDKNFTIYVTSAIGNNPPTDIALSNSSVSENQPSGTLVGALTTTDPDAGDTHTYSFACTIPGADDASFSIAGSSLNTAAVFDYETKNTYSICIRTDDGHGGTFDKNFTINVLDGPENNPPTDISLSNNNVAENQPIGTLVGTLTATDPDVGDTHTYSFACTVPGADDPSFQITGNSLKTNAVFDYETKNNYSICIRTDDGHGGTFDKNFTINVLDGTENNPPTDITLSNNSVFENQTIDTFIGSFTTTDPDPGDNNFTYSFCGGPDDDSFVITGDELLTGGPFDYETKHTYNICVRTDDGHGGTFDKDFTITILDIPFVELVAPWNEEPAHTNRPAFRWNAYAGATNYLIQISTSSSFSSKVTKATLAASVTTYTPKKDLLRNTTYYWRVSARVGGIYIPWSETWSFTTGNPPPIPVLTAPGNKKTVAGPSPLFDWKDVKTIPGVTFLYYKIQISTNANFTTIVGTGYSAESQYNGFTLPPGTYYWRVCSLATNGDFSAWSKVRIVTTK